MNLRKLAFAATVFILLTQTVFAQKALQIDYFETLALNYNEQKSYLESLGLKNNGIIKGNGEYECNWTYKRETIDSTKSECSYHLYLQKDNPRSISFHTYEKDDYTRFKNALKTKGLKQTSTKNYNYFIIEFYSNEKYEATIYGRKEENSTFYEMNLKIK